MLTQKDTILTGQCNQDGTVFFCITVAILCLALLQGCVQAAGISTGLIKAVIELLSIVLLSISLWGRRHRRLPFKGVFFSVPIFVCLVSGLISGVLQSRTLLEIFLFARSILSPVIVFWAILNLEISRALQKWIVLLLGFIFIGQLPVALMKLLIVGVDEKFWIGSLSQNAGQLGFLIPLFALTFLVPIYMKRGGTVFPFLIFGFGAFALINEKRAIVFALPAFFAGAAIIYMILNIRYGNLREENIRIWKIVNYYSGRIVILIVIAVGIAVLATYMIPSLRCDTPPFCFKQNMIYAQDYLNRDYSSPLNLSNSSTDENTNIQLGRVMLIKKSIKHLLDQNISIILFGFGASAINPSPLLGDDRWDILYKKFHLRGTYPSAFSILFEAGLIGFVGMLWFFIMVLRAAFLKAKSGMIHEMGDVYGSAMLLLVFTMMFDFFCYSTVGWSSQTLSHVFFIVIGIFLNDYVENA